MTDYNRLQWQYLDRLWHLVTVRREYWNALNDNGRRLWVTGVRATLESFLYVTDSGNDEVSVGADVSESWEKFLDAFPPAWRVDIAGGEFWAYALRAVSIVVRPIHGE